MDHFLPGFLGTFFGVIAGILVTIGTQIYLQWRQEKQKLENLKFEFRLNIKKIEGFGDEIVKYRNAVNSENLGNYFGYFDLSRVVSVTTNDMFVSGLLYKYLGYEDIGKLQVVFSDFSLSGEDYINKQITQNRLQFNKQQAAINVNFWEEKFKSHKKTLQEILNRLS